MIKEKASYELEGGQSYYISKYEVLNNIMNSSPTTLGKIQKNYYAEKFTTAIKLINSTTANYGKDWKFQIFICLACRYFLTFNLNSHLVLVNSFLTSFFFILKWLLTFGMVQSAEQNPVSQSNVRRIFVSKKCWIE